MIVQVFVARQPILTSNEEVYAYELLYRSSDQNVFNEIDGDSATKSVLINSFLTIGYEQLSEGKPCFINFTENLLKEGLVTYFPPEMIVVEILENIEITQEIVDICRELKGLGYQLALDDFVFNEQSLLLFDLLEVIDIIKIDVRTTSREKQQFIIRNLKPFHVIFLAEKVETREEYEACLEDGYTYFQGYFFSKPVIVASEDIPVYNSVFVESLYELSKQEPDLHALATIIEHDVSLSYKLIKLINSPAFKLTTTINSVKQAIVLLGFDEIRKWIYLLAFTEASALNMNKLNETTKLCLTRAKACELIAFESNKNHDASSYFLTGMFSLMDTLLNRSLLVIISDLPLDQKIKEALLGLENEYKDALDTVLAIENADWDLIEKYSRKINIDQNKLFSIHADSILWSQTFIRSFS
nr:HDOD domain-containing protein [Bacillus suaedae]